MISVIERETAAKKGWVSLGDISDMITIAESTPGVIAVNSATFIGYKVGGFWGSLFATIGVVLPSCLIISGIYFIYDIFVTNKYVAAAFAGIRACVVVLILNAFIKLFKLMDKKIWCYVVCVAAFAVATFTNFSVIYLLLTALVVGTIVGVVKVQKGKTLLKTDNQSGDVQDDNSHIGFSDNLNQTDTNGDNRENSSDVAKNSQSDAENLQETNKQNGEGKK